MHSELLCPRQVCRDCGQLGHNFLSCPRTACTVCGGFGHHASVCDRRICATCGNPGHDAESCPERHVLNLARCSLDAYSEPGSVEGLSDVAALGALARRPYRFNGRCGACDETAARLDCRCHPVQYTKALRRAYA